jgi:hypothetical protein
MQISFGLPPIPTLHVPAHHLVKVLWELDWSGETFLLLHFIFLECQTIKLEMSTDTLRMTKKLTKFLLPSCAPWIVDCPTHVAQRMAQRASVS